MGFLTLGLLVLVIAAALVSYWGALRATNDAYDRSLLDPAVQLASNVFVSGHGARLDMSPKALEALVYDQTDEIVFQIRAPDGSIIAGTDGLNRVSDIAPGKHEFRDGTYRDRPMRIAALHSAGGLVVQVGETLNKRHRLVWEIVASELVPTVLIAVASMLATWAGVTHGLEPLQRVRAQLLARRAQDLTPVADADAPEELLPLVDAFNALLARMREVAASQQRFVANAAHQLRTPLAGLQMHLELLLRREHPPEERDELERLHRAVIRAGHLTRQLLALARAAGDGPSTRPLQVVNIKDMAEEAAQRWVPQALQRGLDLGFALEPAPVRADSVLIGDLLDNLIDNALRYTPAGGSVTVRCGLLRGRPFVMVEDDGPGIPAGERRKVLERFYRLPGTAGEGSGLGLAIVNEVAERYQGTLELESGPQGQGIRVTAVFPAGAAAVLAPAAAPMDT